MASVESHKLAVWALTPNGAELAAKVAHRLPDTDLYLAERLRQTDPAAISFTRLSEALSQAFENYRGHIFIMATGIVVRMIAPLIRHKTVDPAVVVLDETARYAISLLSGHIGGANTLAQAVAQASGAVPVITTATDLNGVPAIDLLACAHGLQIENPAAIKGVNMALLSGQKIAWHNPFNLLADALPTEQLVPTDLSADSDTALSHIDSDRAGVFIDDKLVQLSDRILVLRPGSLAAGLGCNRNTPFAELRDVLAAVLAQHRLAQASLDRLASIDLKSDEPGLLELSEALQVPIFFFEREQLRDVGGIQSPSAMVKKHVGVESVCEAAAILASKNGKLIVAKQASGNVTVAIARKPFIS